uniref:Glucose-1-phosphate adenylyltransferase n=1 Tax=candidate division WOR-3 bacterium TaxID=2052148 RepID=A0A7C4THE7_UNCW3
MTDVLGMILAGGRVDELLTLTEKRPKAAVPIFGIYRFIDFVLTNMMISEIDNVGVLSQYRPYSLMRHIGTGEHWDFIGRKRGVRILPPYKGIKESDWYKGTADAVYQNISYIEEFNPKYVLVAAADHIYQMDYRLLYRYHIEKDADVTVCFTMVREKTPWFGYGIIDKEGHLLGYQEKPKEPPSNWVSMTVYLFKSDLLKEILKENAGQDSHEFGRDVIPGLIGKTRIYGYKFKDLWAYARTIEMYYTTNMEYLKKRGILRRWILRTNLVEGCENQDRIPTRVLGDVSNSVIGNGCVIYGTVRNSILSPGVFVEKNAIVENSIIFHNTIIQRNAHLESVICDKNVNVGESCSIGTFGAEVPSREFSELLKSGITVLGKGVEVPEGTKIGANTVVYSTAKIIDKEIPPGSTLR